jgi:hypothetical protein
MISQEGRNSSELKKSNVYVLNNIFIAGNIQKKKNPRRSF